MTIQTTKGVVLFSRNYREKDKLVKLFTESYGKVMFFIKNGNRPNKSISAAILPFTEAEFVGNIRSEGLSFLNDAKNIQPLYTIQQDIFVNAYATYVLNLVDVAIEDQVYDPALYGFTVATLHLLDEGYDAAILTNIFEVQILTRFGLAFNWQACAICGKQRGKFDFSSSHHGVICEEHFNLAPQRYHADPRGIYFIQQFSQLDIRQVARIKVGDDVKKAIRQILDALYEEFVGIHLKSKRFIDNMETWEDTLRS